MKRSNVRRLLAISVAALLALGSSSCSASVGVGVSVPISGGRPYGGSIWVGGPVWP